MPVTLRHPRESGGPEGPRRQWIPACAGMTILARGPSVSLALFLRRYNGHAIRGREFRTVKQLAGYDKINHRPRAYHVQPQIPDKHLVVEPEHEIGNAVAADAAVASARFSLSTGGNIVQKGTPAMPTFHRRDP